MAINYVKGTRKLAFKEGKPTVQVLKPVHFPNITSEELADEIAQTQGVPKTQVLAVTQAFINRLIHYMQIGHGVQMGDFGIFKVSFSAKSSDDPEKLNADSITTRRILFRPGKAFRTMLRTLNVVSLDSNDNEEDSTSSHTLGETDGGSGGENTGGTNEGGSNNGGGSTQGENEGD